jgi:hypothetical protein
MFLKEPVCGAGQTEGVLFSKKGEDYTKEKVQSATYLRNNFFMYDLIFALCLLLYSTVLCVRSIADLCKKRENPCPHILICICVLNHFGSQISQPDNHIVIN